MTVVAKPEAQKPEAPTDEQTVSELISKMSLAEKIGQLRQVDATGDTVSDALVDAIRRGEIGSIINQSNVELCNAYQRVAVEESRLGLPLLTARDVIHGFNTVFPIPIGQAASWNPELVCRAARASALEARKSGINWTFAPMLDVSRDPRWGRIAESFGEDTYLTSRLGVAMVEGLQGDDLSSSTAIAACAKHFVGYGASESGRDYNTTNIPPNELRNAYLPPFKAVVDAGVASVMTSFSDIDGVPATANEALVRGVLRDEWGFDGLVVSDWDAIRELSVHGLTDGDCAAAFEAATASIDMEMTGDAYANNLATLVEDGALSIETVDTMVRNVLLTKVRLGLLSKPYTQPADYPAIANSEVIDAAHRMARESIVLLRNEDNTLPLECDKLASIAIVGPMADVPYEQLGTWVFDGDPSLSQTPLETIRKALGDRVNITYHPVMDTTRSKALNDLDEALAATKAADIVLVFAGEESILSGEAHSRADINLPGAQAEMIEALAATGTPVVTVILAGRPLTLENIIAPSSAILFAWHPGTMAGPAIYDLLFGVVSPSGKLPVTFPRTVGQIPIYYNHKRTGRPPSPNDVIHIDDIAVGAKQTSLGMASFHLDAGYQPLFPFGFGLTYSEVTYSNLQLSANQLGENDELTASVTLTNSGAFDVTEIVQLYICDLVGSVTRPVRELKGFQRVALEKGASTDIQFQVTASDLAFYRRNGTYGSEPGDFQLWIAPSSDAGLTATFKLV